VRVARLARAGSRVDRVGTPSPAAVEEAAFRREGQSWLVRFGGIEARVADSKGMADLAVLLARPGVEVHVGELVGGGTTPPIGARDALLDDQAIESYRIRLHELAAAEDEADACGDARRATAARAEREAIEDRLIADLGLGGRSRSAPDWVERARKAVRRRIAASLARIESEHRAAGRHLRRSVQTGVFCSYDPAEPVRWHL
jgi:hypothetical protein